MKQGSGVIVAALLLLCPPSLASTLEARDPAVSWQTHTLIVSGNQEITESQIRAQLVTNTRPWYAPWRGRPAFDSTAFQTDLERVRRIYLESGFFEGTFYYAFVVY